MAQQEVLQQIPFAVKYNTHVQYADNMLDPVSALVAAAAAVGDKTSSNNVEAPACCSTATPASGQQVQYTTQSHVQTCQTTASLDCAILCESLSACRQNSLSSAST